MVWWYRDSHALLSGPRFQFNASLCSSNFGKQSVSDFWHAAKAKVKGAMSWAGAESGMIEG